eukprot:TRINITY_DN5762_c0_g1_i1.p1 TRINITY_DN5762_c0_g1~~TRINITY_DN5762_c0_g1_i1.p1  ORF type:complete len:560 (+),score=103.77 TRINITY_DN5762_c0_g1_i1:68-1747(+)
MVRCGRVGWLVLILILVWSSYSIIQGDALVPMSCSNVIVLGGNSTAGGFSMLNPWSIAFVGNYLAIVDHLRVLVYSSTMNITDGSAPTVALTSPDLESYGIGQDNGVSGYVDNTTVHLWVASLSGRFRRYTSPFNFHQTSDQTLTGIFFQPKSLTVDSSKQVLYTADVVYNQVLQYSLSNLSSPISIYGQPLPNLTSPDPPTASSLKGPQIVLLGCQDDIWILDYYNHRLLHYPFNSTEPDTVIGQQSFITNDVGSSAHGLNFPKGAAINNDCSAIWIADTNNKRILKYFAPFSTGMNATEVIGQETLGLEEPIGIALDPISNRIWIADQTTSLITGFQSTNISVNLTSVGPISNNNTIPIIPVYNNNSMIIPLNCSETNRTGVCVIDYPVVVGNGTFVSNYSVVEINGALILSNLSIVVVNPGQTIKVNGNVVFSGSLTITLGGTMGEELEKNGSVVVVVATYNQSQGSFGSIVVNDGGSTQCGVDRQEKYGSVSLEVLVTARACGGEDQRLSVGQWIGIAAGIVGAALLVLVLIVVGTVVGFLLSRPRRKAKKNIVF